MSGRLPIPLPPLEEQRRIADILDRADALRAKRREALALLDDLAQSIFLDMFGDARIWHDDSLADGSRVQDDRRRPEYYRVVRERRCRRC